MRARLTLLLSLAAVLGAGACGSDSGNKQEGGENAAPQTAPGTEPAKAPQPPGTSADTLGKAAEPQNSGH